MTYKSIYMIMTKEEYIQANIKSLEGLLFPEISLEEWYKIQNVDSSDMDIKCNKCGKIQKPWFPFADSESRGVIHHECTCKESKKKSSCPPFTYWA